TYDLVGYRTARIRKPDPQAHEQVAKDTLEEQRHHVGADLSDRSIQYCQPNAAAVHVKVVWEQDQDYESNTADKVAAIYDDPVSQHLLRGNFAARPGHHDQVIAGKQLGASHQDDRQPE